MKPDIDAANTAVRDVVVNHPATRTVFESFGIDYCCGGDRMLADAATAAGAYLHEHIHLENNILFPRTIAMEANGAA